MTEGSARPRLEHYKAGLSLKNVRNQKGQRGRRAAATKSSDQPRRRSHVMAKQFVRATRRGFSGRGPPARDTEMMKRDRTMELSLPQPVDYNLRTRGVRAVPACSGGRPSELTQRMSRTQSKHPLREKVNTYLLGRRRKLNKARARSVENLNKRARGRGGRTPAGCRSK